MNEEIEGARQSSKWCNLQKAACFSQRNRTISLRRSFPIDELGKHELTTVFPKLRMVADEKTGGNKYSSVVANSKEFRGNIPAHLQLSSEGIPGNIGVLNLSMNMNMIKGNTWMLRTIILAQIQFHC
jgi:hypothetical protein